MQACLQGGKELMKSAAKRTPREFAVFAPLKIALAYILFTLLIAVLGPVEYYNFPITKTLLFMLAIISALIIGYFHGVKAGVAATRPEMQRKPTLVRLIFDLSLAIALGALLLSALSTSSAGLLNTSLSGIGEAYASTYEGYERNSGSYSTSFIIYSMSLPFTFIATVWGFYYFRQLGALRRALTVALVVGGLLYYVVGTGKQKQIGDVMIYLIAVGLVKYGVRGKRISLGLVMKTIASALASVSLFIAVLGQRYAVLGVDADNINRHVMDRLNFNQDHLVFKLLGPDYGLTLSIFSSYLSQGYYGLGLALETDWIWTRMTGFSYSVSIIASRFLGFEWQWPNTLVNQVGLETGWGDSKWHTVFPYFATDFTWPGTVLLFGYFAYVYARCWLAAIRYQNPFAILMFALMTMGMFFMPANNQLLHTPGALFTLVLTSWLYLSVGPKFNGADAPRFYRVPRNSRKMATSP